MFDRKLFMILFVAFILFTVIGTLSHEWGHYIVVNILGGDAIIHYGYTTISYMPEKSSYGSSLVTAGGPLQTMLTGSLGLLIVLVSRKRFLRVDILTATQWTILFFTLFWLRQAANFLVAMACYFFRGTYSESGDEIELAIGFGWPPLILSTITALIGLVVFLTVFYFIPAKQRFTFLCALATGSVTGYITWLRWLGPIILP